MKNVVFAALIGLSSSAALASSIEARLAGGTSEIGDGIDKLEYDSTGFDLRGNFSLTPNLFLRGSVLSISADEIEFEGDTFDADIKTTALRIGGGYEAPLGASVVGYGALEYGSFEIEVDDESDDDTGAVISLGLKDIGTSAFLWQVELGYATLKDVKGGTFDLTLGYRATPKFAIVGGLQSYVLEDKEDDTELTVGNAFIGGRFTF